MSDYTTKIAAYSGTRYSEVYPLARRLYNRIKAQTKRQPYVRSLYFKHEKIFLELFWVHLNQKNRSQRVKRLKLYAVAIELLRNTRHIPTTKQNPGKTHEKLYRFSGITPQGQKFYVQVKESSRRGRKDFMSVFPAK